MAGKIYLVDRFIQVAAHKLQGAAEILWQRWWIGKLTACIMRRRRGRIRSQDLADLLDGIRRVMSTDEQQHQFEGTVRASR